MAWRFDKAEHAELRGPRVARAAIRERAAAVGATVTFNPGTDPASVAADAAAADVAIVFGYQRMGEFTDLPDLHLQGGGDALIGQVAAANDSTIVVLNTGSAVEMPWIDDVSGVFEAWYGGEQVGPALAGLLFGDVSPSGKLPMSFPKSLADVPTRHAGAVPRHLLGRIDDAARGIAGDPAGQLHRGSRGGYRWYESQGIEPLFAFGHGLSYTDFEYSHVQVTPKSTDGAKEIRIPFRLTNTGDREGTEIAQAYVELPDSRGRAVASAWSAGST